VDREVVQEEVGGGGLEGDGVNCNVGVVREGGGGLGREVGDGNEDLAEGDWL
jgi:hypothetical protein